MAQKVVSTTTNMTPKAEDLMGNTQLQCNIAGCQSVFKNSGNLRLHLEKHHKLPVDNTKDTSQKLFFCPQPDCVYHENSPNRKHFKCLKYLRQHYQKVHAKKCFDCSKCNKAFATVSLRESHKKNCGKDYTCSECSWSYDSSEALLTHAKRRGHQLKRNSEENSKKIAIPQLKQELTFIAPEPTDRQTQTESNTICIALPPKKRMKVIIAPEVNHFHDTPLCDIETQTELHLNSGLCDPMLYSHMHTQTCDEFLSELGLADIQTQTNWSAADEEDVRQTSRKEEFLSGAHDELMVSTETQTSFTQCLLDSCNEENSLSGCITQHTQTCDTLLEGLFGGQDNDFIGSFQSTHTQT